MRKCSSRAFQWMVISVGFDNFKCFGAISVSHPWWQKSPSVLKGFSYWVISWLNVDLWPFSTACYVEFYCLFLLPEHMFLIPFVTWVCHMRCLIHLLGYATCFTTSKTSYCVPTILIPRQVTVLGGLTLFNSKINYCPGYVYCFYTQENMPTVVSIVLYPRQVTVY
jgi:hypothetical protein